MYYELKKILENVDKVRLIKSRRKAWLCHVNYKGTPKKLVEWKPIGTRIRGRPKKRWIVDIEEDMQIIGIKGWRKGVKEEQNGSESLRRLKQIGGCNDRARRIQSFIH
jgi:hypothetical protein